jgi:GT2 family glycosyltransferase
MNVSIVIPNYNGEKYILDCIASIYDQIENKREIIIIDNHSTDRSVYLIQEHYPDTTLIINDENVGFAAAVNQGIRAASGQYVILLNNDAFAREGFVQALYECISSDPSIFSAAAKMLRYSEPHLIDNAGDEFTIFGWAYKAGDGRPSEAYDKPRVIFSACAGAAIYRKEVFEEIGYFDERFFAYLEDVDIGFRANLHGYKNVFCPSAEVLHIGSATTGSKYNEFKVRISARNNVWMLAKNMPILLLVVNLIFIFLGAFIKIFFFFVKGYGNDHLKGKYEGVKNIRQQKRNNKSSIKNSLRIEYLMISSTIRYIGSKLLKLKP